MQFNKIKYPRVILGEDNFTGWFGKGNYQSEKERGEEYLKTVYSAYDAGIRSYSISDHDTLLPVLKNLKKKNHDITCIANYAWGNCYYSSHQESLWTFDLKNKLMGAIYKKYNLSNNTRFEQTYTDKEIEGIKLDEDELKTVLSKFQGACDYSIVGNLWNGSLLLLNRSDIVQREIEITRKMGFIPVGIAELGGLAIPELEKLDLEYAWIRINKTHNYPNLKSTYDIIKNTNLKLTAYRIFDGRTEFALDESLSFINDIEKITSIVIGVDNCKQVKETSAKAIEYFP